MAYAIGLISGTSLDGCDAALVAIEEGKQTEEGTVRPIGFVTLPMPDALRAKILDCCSLDRSNIGLTCSVNVEIGYWFAEAAKAVCEQSGVPLTDVSVIGSHGQTVYHIPVAEASPVGEPLCAGIPGSPRANEGDWVASTLQIGEPAIIAYETRVPVVSSVRAMDMAAGGRGAPLVPYAEYRLYRSDKPRALQNLGGIGNVTGLPANCAIDDVFAFDTGPSNMIINALAKHFYGAQFDDGGKIAATGTVNEALLSEWMAIPYVMAPPPKATGRELYGAQFVEEALRTHPGIAPANWLATATMYTAATIEANYRAFVFPRCPAKEVILSGGGAHNLTMRRDIAARLPECTVLTQEDLGWSSDSKEAVAFALMAHETIHGRPSNVPSATGASRPVILGSITRAPY